jgi:hypothetical protein
MLFRTSTGGLIEVKKYDFSSDKLYYKKIMDIKKSAKQLAFSKLEKAPNNINK